MATVEPIREETLSRLSRSEWMSRRAHHRARVAPWTKSRVERSQRGEPHPVYDFLFDYYSFRPASLERWSPGIDALLDEVSPEDTDWPNDFQVRDGGSVLNARNFPLHRHAYLTWAIRYLSITAERPPSFYCFGLHEWAMVYRSETVRHSYVPLRLSMREINEVVEAQELRCTHYDAFRFFTPEATPLNRTPLTREATSENDQRGCIHVTMDLYRFAIKVAPYISAELTADAFLLAADARTIDMRASPYDLSAHGFDPICIETTEGRSIYIDEQRRLAELAISVRRSLLSAYERLLHRAQVGE